MNQPIDVAAAMQRARPHLAFDYDYTVLDGELWWSCEEEQPTQAELEAAYKEHRRAQKVEEMAECALEEIRGLFRTSLPSYEVLGIHNARLLHGNDEEYPPRYLAVMEMIQNRNEKLERKLYEVVVADDPASVEW